MSQQPRTDKRIVYGAGCTWWDSIDKIGLHDTGRRDPLGNGKTHKLPCCPHCRGMLFEMPDETIWNAGVSAYDAKHPGYKAMMAWARGKFFRDFNALQVAYDKRGEAVS